MAHRKISALERLRWRSRCLLHQGRDAHQRDGVLGHRQHRPCIHALLRRAQRRATALDRRGGQTKDSGRTRCRRLRDVPEGPLPPAARVGRAILQRAALDGIRAAAAISRPWNSRKRLPRTFANSSAHCETRNDLASQPARIFSSLSISNAPSYLRHCTSRRSTASIAIRSASSLPSIPTCALTCWSFTSSSIS